MIFYCIVFRRTYTSGGSAEHKFFCYAETEKQAKTRFCTTTGLKQTNILSISEQGEEDGDNRRY